MRKLEGFEIEVNLLCWFQSCILYRSQFIILNAYRSTEVICTSGIPQYSILGPM